MIPDKSKSKLPLGELIEGYCDSAHPAPAISTAVESARDCFAETEQPRPPGKLPGPSPVSPWVAGWREDRGLG
ncbi:hypothetical protein LNP74_32155 [Klebsiella pneumoniae subsp. pneumoniae]|nr:hypothetical protein [Klebsiella pneumoniae subsp. pneumoniae]